MPSIPGLMLLGLLAERDWTAYDLVKQVKTRSIVNVIWNVSERTLYREPARLAAEGLVAASATDADGRSTTYSITERGREVLAAARHERNEFVHRNEVLAMLYAVAGESSDHLVRRLLDLRDEFRDGIEANGRTLRAVAQTAPTMPNRALMTSLLTRLHTDLLLVTEQWIGDAIAAVESVDDEDRGEFAVAEWTRIADAIDAAVSTWRGATRSPAPNLGDPSDP